MKKILKILSIFILLLVEAISIIIDWLIGFISGEAVLWIYKFRQECYDPIKRLERLKKKEE